VTLSPITNQWPEVATTITWLVTTVSVDSFYAGNVAVPDLAVEYIYVTPQKGSDHR